MRAAGIGSGTLAFEKCELACDLLESFGKLHFPATGWSMLPTVWPGDTLVVEPIKPSQLRIGDIVVIHRKGNFIGHRIVWIGEEPTGPLAITQGDALGSPDQPVGEIDLLGKIAYLIRAGKCVPVPRERRVVDRFLANALRRSNLLPRALVFVHNKVRVSRESVVPCQS
jgi:signal peptidase I